jgi:hypothetical protein
MVEVEKTLLWSANAQAPTNSNITFLDSVDNYEEIQIYGSGDNIYSRLTINEYPIISGKMMIGGPSYIGKWGAGDTWLLVNGTRMGWSGTSARVMSSFYYGKNNNATTWGSQYCQNRASDIRPYKIYGITYPKNYDRTLIWETTGNPYNTSITLSEPITHFRQIMVYGSGSENNDTAGKKTTKNIYDTINGEMGADPWGYTPWALNSNYNYTIGCDTVVSGNSGYIGSAWCWGMNNSTAYAGYRWVDGNAPLMMVPWKIWGINRKPNLKLKLLNSIGGTLSADLSNGYEFDIATLTNTTASEDYKFSSYNITGATLTGDQFQFGTNDVKVQGNFEHNKTLTLIDGDHGVLSADKDKGFIGDIVTITGTMDEGWYLTGFNTTGATMTGNKFAFAGEDVTVEGLYTDEGFPVVYEAENGVHLTGDPIAIPGQGITLTTSYDTYYRTNGYDITGGYIEDGMLYATAPCTARLKSKLNAFTATGGFEKGSNIVASAKGSGNKQYKSVNLPIILKSSTGDIPASWHSTSNRWNPSNASAYSIKVNAKASFSMTEKGYLTACIRQNNSNHNTVTTSYTGDGTKYYYYSQTYNTTAQSNIIISAYLLGQGYNGGWGGYTQYAGYCRYLASGTTGTWTATGIAP